MDKSNRLAIILAAVLAALALVLLITTAVHAQGPLPTPYVSSPTATPIPVPLVSAREVPRAVIESSNDWTLWLGLAAVVIVLAINKFRRW